jgi:mono/diheme cytochrome c family protein
MPAFTAKVLSDQELSDLYAYVKSLPAAKPAKDIPLLSHLREK